MRQIDITIFQAKDGTYNAYCNDHPAIFGMGDTVAAAKKELEKTLLIIKEDGPKAAFVYPEWLDDEYEFVTHWDVQTMLNYYAGVLSLTALGKLTGIHPKQIWSYMHGTSHPRPRQVDKIASAIHKLGHELVNTRF